METWKQAMLMHNMSRYGNNVRKLMWLT